MAEVGLLWSHQKEFRRVHIWDVAYALCGSGVSWIWTSQQAESAISV